MIKIKRDKKKTAAPRVPAPTPRTSDAGEVMTADEVAAFLRVSRGTVANLVRRGKLPRSPIGGRLRFLRDDVLELFRARKTT